MEKIKKAGEKIKGKAEQGFLGMVEDLLGSIDAFDQIAALLKTVVPLKAEITVKGKKTVEVRALIRNGELWVGFRRIRGVQTYPYEPLKEDVEEATEETETTGCDYCSKS